MTLRSSQGHRRLRFSFLLHLSKSSIPSRRDKTETPFHSHPLCSARIARASSPAPQSKAAVDEVMSNRSGRSGQHSFQKISDFLSVHLRPQRTDKAKPFSEDAFSSELYLSRGRCPSTNIWMLRQRSRQVPQIAPWSWAHVSRQR